jgi:Putative peptidoglycan binding domain
VAALAPSLAFAAYNDVTLTTDAVISVGGYTLNVSGSSAVIQSIVVNSTNFSVTLASGSSFTVSSPTLQKLSSDVTSDVINNTCKGSASSISLAYSSAGTVTNVITPSATLCSSSGSFGGGGGGGGGGLIVGSGPLAPSAAGVGGTVLHATTTSSTSPATPQSTTIASTSTTPAAPGASHVSITRNHRLGDHGSDVLALQQFLNTHGFVVAQSGLDSTGSPRAGSPGHETNFFGAKTFQALKRFQQAHGLPATAVNS